MGVGKSLQTQIFLMVYIKYFPFFQQYSAPWVEIVIVMSISFGGIGNALQYGINEGWDASKGSTNDSSTGGLTGSGSGTNIQTKIEIKVLKNIQINQKYQESLEMESLEDPKSSIYL